MTMTMKRWWLSFIDPKLPKGSQSLGVAIVEAFDYAGAIRVAWLLGINPGGEVLSMQIDPDEVAKLSFDITSYYDRRITPNEATELADRISRELAA